MQTAEYPVQSLKGLSGHRDIDGYRLLALSRIPQCKNCLIYRSLQNAHETRGIMSDPPPPVNMLCSHPYCAPLVTRFSA